MLRPPVVLIAGNDTPLPVETMVKESVLLAVPKLLMAPANVIVPPVPALKVRFCAPVIVAAALEKLILAPPADPPEFVVSKVTAAPKVTAALVIVIEPAAVVILPPKLIVGLTPEPVYKTPTPPLAVVVTVLD